MVPFSKAKIGETSYVYSGDYIRDHTDFGWVCDLEYFDDRDGPITLTRQVWQLVSEDEITLPDSTEEEPDGEAD